MSFLSGLSGLGGMAGAAAAGGGALKSMAPLALGSVGNSLANGLGGLLHSDGKHVSDIANRIGTGMNTVAAAGGAQPGYVGGPQQEAAPDMPNNHLQMLDDETLSKLLARFKPGTGAQF